MEKGKGTTKSEERTAGWRRGREGEKINSAPQGKATDCMWGVGTKRDRDRQTDTRRDRENGGQEQADAWVGESQNRPFTKMPVEIPTATPCARTHTHCVAAFLSRLEREFFRPADAFRV